MIERKSSREIAKQAAAGAIAAETLALMREEVRPGITTAELDRSAERFIRGHGGIPTFKGYHGFPGSICTSPNDMIVHGIPGAYELQEGDVLSIDVGVTYNGFVGDSAVTFAIGAIDDEARKLLEVCQESLRRVIAVCQVGNHLSDLGHACQTYVEAAGFGVVRELVGHGVGRRMHEAPQIPNYGAPGRGPELRDGMVFAIEPMITAGAYTIRVADDDWSIFTTDGSLAAHFEHTVAITHGGPQVLTRAGGASVVDDGV